MRAWPRIGAAFAALAWAAPVAGLCDTGIDEALRRCGALAADAARLACFDALAAERAAPGFEGFGGAVTPLFDAAKGDTLTYRSEDVILVLTLLDPAGAVVKNLHLGGQGEAQYRFPASGRYRVQVDASGGWQLRLQRAASAAP